MTPVLVEACVESIGECLAAERGGADRLELGANMDVGGTTPDRAVLTDVKSRVAIPVSVMIRPRGGSFVHSPSEIDAMRRDIDSALASGADMLVIGVLTPDGRVDQATTRELVARARGTPVTFHRAFDELADQPRGLDELIEAGVARVLTSGGAATALEGAERLAALVEQSAGRIAIMAGGTVRGPIAAELVRRSGVREVHARSLHDETRIRDLKRALWGTR